MDRRSFLKSTGIALGGLTAASLVTTGQAATGTVSPTAKAAPLSAENPLLLNFNENSLGMSPKARQAIIDALPGAFRYPDAAREALIEQIAAHFSLTPEHISLGNGSSETIQAAVQMLVADAQMWRILKKPATVLRNWYRKPVWQSATDRCVSASWNGS